MDTGPLRRALAFRRLGNKTARFSVRGTERQRNPLEPLSVRWRERYKENGPGECRAHALSGTAQESVMRML